MGVQLTLDVLQIGQFVPSLIGLSWARSAHQRIAGEILTGVPRAKQVLHGFAMSIVSGRPEAKNPPRALWRFAATSPRSARSSAMTRDVYIIQFRKLRAWANVPERHFGQAWICRAGKSFTSPAWGQAQEAPGRALARLINGNEMCMPFRGQELIFSFI